MLQTTQDTMRAVLRADPSLTPGDRSRMLGIIRNHGKTPANPGPTASEPRLIRRADVARRMGCSLRTLDNWARTGILRKVTLPGRIRAAGFRESDVSALIAGKGD